MCAHVSVYVSVWTYQNVLWIKWLDDRIGTLLPVSNGELWDSQLQRALWCKKGRIPEIWLWMKVTVLFEQVQAHGHAPKGNCPLGSGGLAISQQSAHSTAQLSSVVKVLCDLQGRGSPWPFPQLFIYDLSFAQLFAQYF